MILIVSIVLAKIPLNTHVGSVPAMNFSYFCLQSLDENKKRMKQSSNKLHNDDDDDDINARGGRCHFTSLFTGELVACNCCFMCKTSRVF